MVKKYTLLFAALLTVSLQAKKSGIYDAIQNLDPVRVQELVRKTTLSNEDLAAFSVFTVKIINEMKQSREIAPDVLKGILGLYLFAHAGALIIETKRSRDSENSQFLLDSLVVPSFVAALGTAGCYLCLKAVSLSHSVDREKRAQQIKLFLRDYAQKERNLTIQE
jgi:hypothetical protein